MDEETIKLGVNATPQFIGALTELVWVQIGMLPRDSTNFPRIWRVAFPPMLENGISGILGRSCDSSHWCHYVIISPSALGKVADG